MAKEEGGDDKKFTFPKVNEAFDLPELPECTGMNGFDTSRKVECRQVGRYTDKNWFLQLQGDDAKEEKKIDYNKLTGGTPQLPECTGMNGTRKHDSSGNETDCRQIGRYNGPWPVTEDVQLRGGDLPDCSTMGEAA